MPVPDLAISAAIVSDLVRQLHHITKDNDQQIHALQSDVANLKSLFSPTVMPMPSRGSDPDLTGTAATGTGQGTVTAMTGGLLPPVPSDLTSSDAPHLDESHTNTATTTAASSTSPSAVGSPTMISRDGPMSSSALVVQVPEPGSVTAESANKSSAEASTETSSADFVASTAVQTSPKDDTVNDATPLMPTLPVVTQAKQTTTDPTPSAVPRAVGAAAEVKESAVQTRNVSDPQIAALKKDNAALLSTLKEYESTLELIMSKFRSYALSTQNEKKLLSQDHAKQLDQERLAAQSHALTNVQLAQQLERAHAAIRASLQASAEDDAAVLAELAAAQTEAQTLRDVVAVHEETRQFHAQLDHFLAHKAPQANPIAPPQQKSTSSQEPLPPPPAAADPHVVSPKDDQPLQSSALPNPHSPPTHPLPLDASSTPLASATPAPAPSSPPTLAAADPDPTPVLSPRSLAPPPPADAAQEPAPTEDSESKDQDASESKDQDASQPPAAPALPAANPLVGLGGSGSLSMSRSTSNPFLQSTLGAGPLASGTPPLGVNPLLGPLATPAFGTATAPATGAAEQEAVAVGDWGDWSDDLGVPLDTGATQENK